MFEVWTCMQLSVALHVAGEPKPSLHQARESRLGECSECMTCQPCWSNAPWSGIPGHPWRSSMRLWIKVEAIRKIDVRLLIKMIDEQNKTDYRKLTDDDDNDDAACNKFNNAWAMGLGTACYEDPCTPSSHLAMSEHTRTCNCPTSVDRILSASVSERKWNRKKNKSNNISKRKPPIKQQPVLVRMQQSKHQVLLLWP